MRGARVGVFVFVFVREAVAIVNHSDGAGGYWALGVDVEQ